MTDQDLEKRFEALEKAVEILRDVLSSSSAQGNAQNAAICGLLDVVGGLPGVRLAVNQRLESAHSINLGMCINQASVDAFEQNAEVLREAMANAELRTDPDSP